MDLRTKHILAISAVAGIAGTIGYLLGRRHKDKPEELEQEPEQETRTYEYFENNNGRGIRTKSPELKWEPNPLTDNLMDHLIKDYVSNDIEDDEDEDPENLRTQGEIEYTSTEPYIIPEDEVFIDGNDPEDIETLMYYKKDEVLTDSFDEIVDSQRDIIGDIALRLVQDDTIYVRNPITKRDYEIVLINDAYEQEILGADDEQYKNAVKFFNLKEE